ncbi:MAG TPA: CoA-acylating methylmalonate-semialdehyde dehydrogenase [Burkholderiales bacterium]|nr:CoA-acylating methylmalonate-semialdehyde dehydrogenase [Burkholderiales bacterium]
MNKPAEAHSLLPLWIGGEKVASQSVRYGDVTNPASGEVIRRVPFANSADIDAAVGAAGRAFSAWCETPPLKRGRIMMRFLQLLEKNRDRLTRLVTEEHGKTLADAGGSVQRGIEVVEFSCGVPHLLKGEHAENIGADIDCYSLRQALGICAGITPFNFPVMVPLWMFPVAIACGNTFILKPSEKVPSASLFLAELLKEAGLPDGVFNVVHGDKEAVDAILHHPEIKAVSFVGSTPVARYIYETCAENGKRVQALGGAKNHAVVLPDADMEFAADSLIGAAYGSAGERCMAVSAVVAVGDIAESLVTKLRAKAAALKVGPGDSENTEMGPLITRAHRDRVAKYIELGEKQGAKLVLDGRGLKIPGHESGFYLGPTLFDHVRPEMAIYRDEIFGPVLIVLRVGDFNEAIRLVNRNPHANGTAIFTRTGALARRFQHEIEVGMVGINIPIPVPMAYFSFGGWKNSLFGDLHVHGTEGIQFYTRSKVVTCRWPTQTEKPKLDMPTH